MMNIYRKVGWFIKEQWKMYIFMLFLLLSIAAISLAPAYVLGQAIDTIVSGGLTSESLWMLVGLLVLLPVARYFISFTYNHLSHRTAQLLSYKLR